MTSTCSGKIKLQAWPRSCVIGCTFSLSLTNILGAACDRVNQRNDFLPNSNSNTTANNTPVHNASAAIMPTPPPSNNIPAPSETGSDPTSNWGSRYRGVRFTSPNKPILSNPADISPSTGRSRRPRPRPRPLNPPHHPRRPSPLLRLRARLHAPHSPRPDL